MTTGYTETETLLLDDNKQLKAIHEADILSLKNLVRECDEYKIRLSQAQESINYWMEAADEARAQITIARIQERESCSKEERIKELEKELSALKSQSQEPIGFVGKHVTDTLREGHPCTTTMTVHRAFNDDTAIYAAPPIPADKVMVPKPDTISEFDGGSLRGFCIGIYYHEREKFELAYRAMIEAAKEG